MDVIDITEDKSDSQRKCEYCGKSYEAEHISDEKDYGKN
jgi:hypothetical protein